MIWVTVKRNTNYEVSSTGLVRSKDRVTTNKLGIKIIINV